MPRVGYSLIFRALLWLVLLGVTAVPSCGQVTVDNRLTTTHTQLGIGASSLYNTYLSPLVYEGEHFVLSYARQRATRHLDGRVHWQSVWRGLVAQGATPTSDDKSYQIALSYATRWLHTWQPWPVLYLRAGLGAEVHFGGQYNGRNGNNPATLDAALHLPLTLQAYYAFRIGRLPLGLHYQLDIPLLGVQWAPRYTQSYYELLSLKAHRGVMAVGWWGNIPSWRQQLHVTMPLGHQHITLGVYGDIRQHTLRGVRQHAWHYGVSVGYVRQLRAVSAKAQRRTFIY